MTISPAALVAWAEYRSLVLAPASDLADLLDANDTERNWLPGKTLLQLWTSPDRPVLMVRAAGVVGVDLVSLALATIACARTTLPIFPSLEGSPLAVLDTMDAWARGETSQENADFYYRVADRVTMKADRRVLLGGYDRYQATLEAARAVQYAAKATMYARCGEEYRKTVTDFVGQSVYNAARACVRSGLPQLTNPRETLCNILRTHIPLEDFVQVLRKNRASNKT